MIAISARSDNIVPILAAIFTRRNHVIERQIFRCELLSAILAGVIIAKVDILARKFEAGRAARSHILFKPYHAGQTMILPLAANALGMVLENFDFTLKPKNESLLPTD